MNKLTLLSLFAVLFLTTFANANCTGCLFYGGDFDPNNPNAQGLANENVANDHGNPYGAATYQSFSDTFTPWNVTALFTNDLMSVNPATAYWEIRAGISEGNGGTLIASGTGTDTVTPTGRSFSGTTEYTNLVSGLNLTIIPGDYWMAVVPQDLNDPGGSANSNTFGLNSIGHHGINNQYFNSPVNGFNYVNANNFGDFATFSSGVIGTEVVPEPASLMLLATGVLGLAGVARYRLLEKRTN